MILFNSICPFDRNSTSSLLLMMMTYRLMSPNCCILQIAVHFSPAKKTVELNTIAFCYIYNDYIFIVYSLEFDNTHLVHEVSSHNTTPIFESYAIHPGHKPFIYQTKTHSNEHIKREAIFFQFTAA